MIVGWWGFQLGGMGVVLVGCGLLFFVVFYDFWKSWVVWRGGWQFYCMMLLNFVVVKYALIQIQGYDVGIRGKIYKIYGNVKWDKGGEVFLEFVIGILNK